MEKIRIIGIYNKNVDGDNNIPIFSELTSFIVVIDLIVLLYGWNKSVHIFVANLTEFRTNSLFLVQFPSNESCLM